MSPPPPNAYKPGLKLTVGSHNVSIIKYISQGGFAHVYTCTIDPPFQGNSVACLKRVVVPSKWQLNLLRQEVDAMKRLRGNPTIVSYIDSHASRLNETIASVGMGGVGGDKQQYEVFLLMEYCSNNGLIDFMNTRLTNKLTEPEILVIMKDITLAVAMCHHLQPPLLHRDIKIENVLLDDKRTYKLCDFGSAVGYSPVPKNSQEFNELFEDIMQHTTPQYRSPEMIELSRGFPIDDKADIWALGCFLYKLCYYTTPFENQRQTSLQDLEHSILNCAQTLKIPHNMPGSNFSPRMKNIIKCCLREDPRRRPNAVQLLEELCAMMNQKVPNYIPASVLERPVANSYPSNHLLKSHHVNSQSSPQLPVRQSSKTDPFASIDKTKVLAKSPGAGAGTGTGATGGATKVSAGTKSSTTGQSQTSQTRKPYGLSRPKSLYESRTVSPPVLKDYIDQLSKSNENLASNEGTLDFLKEREELEDQDTGSSFTKFKTGLRRISTGNSVKSQNNTGNYNYKRSSISSIKQLLTGGSSRKVSNPEKDKDEDVKPPKKLSIQRRMAQYLNSGEDDVKKTASGYGKYTAEDDLNAINDMKPPKVPVNLSSKKLAKPKSLDSPLVALQPVGSTKSISTMPTTTKLNTTNTVIPTTKSTTNSIPSKSPKRPPPKPKKPVYLRTPENNFPERRLSNSSEISLPDLDDLEKQFAKRFPSYV
ncbi:actin-regulating kinase Prk1p [[Candida] jaroonii]|uniref:Actin-regulating kinase Prk1p n=1 Tax=[Candida] jaroonii TaxID=467808 RepID=A0ACA9Y751_9ASCO|nr:actin-regulating kinase Prk1p [[Candida] jaroonii]